jgi:hypothetical protein
MKNHVIQLIFLRGALPRTPLGLTPQTPVCSLALHPDRGNSRDTAGGGAAWDSTTDYASRNAER